MQNQFEASALARLGQVQRLLADLHPAMTVAQARVLIAVMFLGAESDEPIHHSSIAKITDLHPSVISAALRTHESGSSASPAGKPTTPPALGGLLTNKASRGRPSEVRLTPFGREMAYRIAAILTGSDEEASG